MLVKLVAKNDAHNIRVQMIKELRSLTGFGLKEASDMISSSTTKGSTFEVNLLPGKQNSYMEFFSVYNSRSEVQPVVRHALNIAIDNNEFGLAKDLLSIMEKWL